MDAKGFFSQVIDKNYKEWKADPDDFTKYWNAAVSMNTAAEFLALHRGGYPELTRTEVDVKVAAIRSEYPELKSKTYRIIDQHSARRPKFVAAHAVHARPKRYPGSRICEAQ